MTAPVSLSLVRRYLQASGWHVERRGRKYSLYARPVDQEILELPVPNRRDAASAPALYNIVRTLSQLENKSEQDVIFALTSFPFDVIRSTLPERLVSYDSIALDVASKYISTTKRLLAASATVEINPRQHFFRVRKEELVYANQCRFGHTFRGSFGFTIESPFSDSIEDDLSRVRPSLPFARRVVQRLANGFTTIEEATRKEDSNIIISRYETGLNANMCDDLVSLFDVADKTEIIFSFTWSPQLEVPDTLREHLRFSIDAKAVEILKEAGSRLRIFEKQMPKTVTGLVIRLRSEQKPSDSSIFSEDRDVVIRWVSAEFGRLNVHVALSSHDYLLAVTAHHDGEVVSVSGLLEKVGRKWVLHNPRNFVVGDPISET